jgi:hypothetical protein
MVGLGNVDNTSDANKPVSLQLNGFRFKSTFEFANIYRNCFGIDKTMVGLSNVDNTSDANKPVSSSAQTA